MEYFCAMAIVNIYYLFSLAEHKFRLRLLAYSTAGITHNFVSGSITQLNSAQSTSLSAS
jgi:hypothetical protein